MIERRVPDGLEILLQLNALVVVGYLRRQLVCFRQVTIGTIRVAGDHGGSGQRFASIAEVECLFASAVAQAQFSVTFRLVGATEQRADAGELPVADGKVLFRAVGALCPVPKRRV
jgi:hypothetical protein